MRSTPLTAPLLAALLLAGATAGPASAGSPPVVHATLIIRASGASQSAVRLANPLVHPFGTHDPELTVTGRGRFDGLVLLPRGRSLHAPTTALVVGALPLAARPHPTLILGGGRNPLPGSLAAGDYELYIAASGPVVVTLRLPGQPAGATTLTATPTRAVRADDYSAGVVPQHVAAPAFAAGHTVRANADGVFTASFIWKDADAQVSSIQGTCLYPGGARTPLEYSTPACIGGIGGEVDGLLDLRTPADTVGFSWTHLGVGTWGLKDYYVTAAAPNAAGIDYLTVIR